MNQNKDVREAFVRLMANGDVELVMEGDDMVYRLTERGIERGATLPNGKAEGESP